MSKELVKDVLRNAFGMAAQTLTLVEIQQVMTEELMRLSQSSMKMEELLKINPIIKSGQSYQFSTAHDEKSFETDAKEIDDAQRYRDLKNG